MFPRLLLALLCLLLQHEHSVCAFRVRRKAPVVVTLDHRSNRIPEATAETLWAVRVLRAAGMPNVALADKIWPGHWDGEARTNMDLLWAWIEAMQGNDNKNSMPFSLNPPMTQEAETRNQDPANFIAALHTGHSFKNGVDEDGRQIYGMDFYVNHRLEDYDHSCKMPDGKLTYFIDRDSAVRSAFLFTHRGRVGVGELPDGLPLKSLVLSRTISAQNRNAGIVPLEATPQEALNFFPTQVVHGGKNFNVRTGQGNISSVFYKIGAPFIAGPSGSIEYMILSMEDTCLGACADGLVPFRCHKVREALLSLMTAALIAGGQHSLGECLAVAQAMGYFQHVPNVLENYHLAAQVFESYSAETLGVAPTSNSRPLGQMSASWFQAVNTAKRADKTFVHLRAPHRGHTKP